MYDPKFEKAIQQKMEELEFRPPESVWVNIEKAVVVKRRRRTGFVWRYLLPAAFLVAAAGIYMHYAGVSRTTSAAAHSATTAHSATADHSTATPAGSNATANSSISASDNATANSHTVSGSLVSRFMADNLRKARNTAAGRMTAQGGDAAASTAQSAGHTSTNGYTTINEHTSINRSTPKRGNASTGEYTSGSESARVSGNMPAGENTSTSGDTQAGENTSTNGQTLISGQTSTAGAAGQKGLPAWFYLPGLANPRLTPQVQGAALNTKKSNAVSLAGLSHPQRHWEAGFVAGGGLSRLNRLNSEQAKAALTSTVTSLYTFAGASSNKTYISNTRPEASFDGGIYLQKALSDRWIFNTGMNLHYYSNRISVGQELTTYVQASVSFFIPTTTPAARNTSMYSAGNIRSFTNKYYFLELPAGMQWKVSKNHLLPIFLQGGVSLSRLMGASALFYDAKTGLYSKNGDAVNKTQFNVSSALLFGLPFHGVAIQVGPEIQYGLTPLVNTQGLGDQHFLYTGIRLVIIPGRK